MDLTITRGDTKMFAFKRFNADHETILEKADAIYFTVKKPSLPKDYIFQKTIDDMLFDDNGVYHFQVEPSDTDGIRFGKYRYDIQVVDEGTKTTIANGYFIVKEEVTFAENEG